MDPILETFLSWQFLVFGIAVVAMVFVIGTIAEYLLANSKFFSKESKLWRELIKPILPILVGCLGAIFIRKYPYPDGLTSKGSRFIFGLVAGLLSTFLGRLASSVFNQKININNLLPSASPAPPPSPPPVNDGNSMSAGNPSNTL